MKISKFVYHTPTSIEEALGLLAELGPDAKVLAGGQSLLPLMALRLGQPEHLVDLGGVADLRPIEPREGVLAVGARVRHVDLERSEAVRTAVPLLAEAMPYIGHRAIRNRGTACGSLAHADPAAELPAVALALGAEFVLRRLGGQRVVPAAEFFLGYLSADIEPDEMLVEVRFPVSPPSAGWSVQEVSRRHGDFALLGMTTLLDTDAAGRVAQAAISLFGVAGTPVRATAAEDLLVGEEPSAELFAAAATAVSASIDPPDDNHASAAYRRHVSGVLTRRCLTEAADRAEEAA